LIGEVDYLLEEVVSLVQLAQPILLSDITEVRFSTKFVFIALGPKGSMDKLREIGRCLGTLFSDEVILKFDKIILIIIIYLKKKAFPKRYP
jgi:hypothetical protein